MTSSGFSLREIGEWIAADRKPAGFAAEIVTDSRQVRPGCLFVALAGERFDGHAFVADALNKGAVAAVVHKDVDAPAEKLLRVGDTAAAFRAIARMHRLRLHPFLVAVTGSVGKTSTREMIAAVLSARWNTHKTEANLNNQVGVPQTLLQMTAAHQAAVIEMGMSGLGEIEEISLAAMPDMAVITSVGVEHLELLGSREKILEAKLEIRAGLRAGGALLLCGDNDLLRTVRDDRFHLVFYGIENEDADIFGADIREGEAGCAFTIRYQGGQYPAQIPAVGRHNVLNALAGFGAGVLAGMAPGEAAAALAGFAASGQRQKFTSFHGFTVVEDCYNAGPQSMRAALTTLAARPAAGRRIAVLADMLELGAASDEAHTAVGRLAAELGLDAVWCYGPQAALTAAAARAGGVPAVAHCDTLLALTEYVTRQLRLGDILWVKGSHGMHLEQLVEAIYQNA